MTNRQRAVALARHLIAVGAISSQWTEDELMQELERALAETDELHPGIDA